MGTDLPDLNRSLNEALSKIENPHINYFLDNLTAVIEYETVSLNNICCECKFWDSTDSENDVVGICHKRGKRLRFNCRACDYYDDIRK